MKKHYFIICLMLISSFSFSQWTYFNSGTTEDLYSIYFYDNNHGYVAGDGVYRWGGSSGGWPGMTTSTEIYYSIYFTSIDTGYIAGGFNFSSFECGIIRKTTSGGTGFSDVLLPTDTVTTMDFTDASTGYVAGRNGLIIKTTDAGSNWTILTSGTTKNLESINFPDANTGYVAGLSGTILKTINAGITWTSQTSGTSVDLYSIFFTDVNKGYAVGDNGTILKTTDGGTNWIPQTSGITNSLRSVYFPSANIGYVAGYGGKILKTFDTGINWIETNSLSVDLNSVYFLDDNTGYVAGYNGIILKTTNGGGVTSINELRQNQKISIFPNPTTGKITIKAENVERVEIMNIEGKQIYTGKEIQIDLSSKPIGIYIIKVCTNKGVAVEKIILN